MASTKLVVFTDASVVVAAALSETGGSALVFALAKKGIVDLILTEEVFQEARLSIQRKYDDQRLAHLYQILAPLKKSIKLTPSQDEQRRFADLIDDQRDCHILAGAERYRANTLLTLDRKHFFTAKLKEAELVFNIQLPAEFLAELRSKLSKNC